MNNSIRSILLQELRRRQPPPPQQQKQTNSPSGDILSQQFVWSINVSRSGSLSGEEDTTL